MDRAFSPTLDLEWMPWQGLFQDVAILPIAMHAGSCDVRRISEPVQQRNLRQRRQRPSSCPSHRYCDQQPFHMQNGPMDAVLSPGQRMELQFEMILYTASQYSMADSKGTSTAWPNARRRRSGSGPRRLGPAAGSRRRPPSRPVATAMLRRTRALDLAKRGDVRGPPTNPCLLASRF